MDETKRLKFMFIEALTNNQPNETLVALAEALSYVAGKMNVKGSVYDIHDAVEALQRAAGTHSDQTY
jgi:hypothetical protein